jgi:uncharacterized protein (DUF1697 family)
MSAARPVRCVALLRAVNVGARQVPMDHLREIAHDLGGQDVETYLRSGNVILSVPADQVADLPGALEAACTAAFGFEIPVVVRTGDELAAAVEGNPFPLAAAAPTTLHGSFLPGPPAPDAFTGLPADDGEELHVVGRDLYLHLPFGVGRSRLAAALARRGRVGGTARNWTTVEALASRTAR